ncbi:uncharacterized protein [Nicotiana sylvestris]|uniref:uncharacterized protein n=1 Tax=Nicotiana sylvestris TaxID=4096 RepID=UPI00388CE4F7
MGRIENILKQMREECQLRCLASHNTSIRNLEVQMGKISQSLNTRPKVALPSDTVVNPNDGKSTGHAMAVITRSGKGGNEPTSSKRQLVDEEQVVKEEEILNNVEQSNDDVRIDIEDSMEETQEEVNPYRDHIIDMPEPVVQKAKAPLPEPPPPYPQRLAKQNDENLFKKFIQMMKSLSINVPLFEALEKMPGYAKSMNDLVTKKQSMNFKTIKMSHQVSAIVHSMAPKLEDLGAFTIPCIIGNAEFAKAFCDLGESINLMPYSVFKTLGIGQPRPTSMRLQMANRTMKKPLGVIEDVLVHVDKFILLVNFLIFDCEIDYEVDSTLVVLKKRKKAIRWTLADIRGISPVFFMHKINLEEGAKPSIEHQRRLNEAMQKRMPFGFCNAPMTFQRCMLAIFIDMVEDYLGVLMDDSSMVRNSFDDCLANLDKMLARCEETHLVLNWEKCHFMVEEGIDLGHKISKNGIEVDKVKIEVISKLPPPTSKKGVQSFLGHAGFYRCFIKDFSKVVNPLCKLLGKDAKFHFNDDLMRTFELLKFKLTTTPIITTPNWSVPFELMCDVSDVVVGDVLGQCINKIFHPVYYASKTMNSAQVNYTITEKELLSIVFAIEKFRLYLMGA